MGTLISEPSGGKETPLPELIRRYKQLSAESDQFAIQSQIIHTHHSTAIDGCMLSLTETQLLLERGLTACGKPFRHHEMIIDYHLAQRRVLALANERAPINRVQLQVIAAQVMRRTGGTVKSIVDSFNTARGEFRTFDTMNGMTPSVEARKVPTAIDDLLKTVNTILSEPKTMRQVYELSFETYYQLMRIHPFGEGTLADGNGRIAQLLMSYIQHFHRLPISLVYVEDKDAYCNALTKARKSRKPQPMIEFMYGQLVKYLTFETNSAH